MIHNAYICVYKCGEVPNLSRRMATRKIYHITLDFSANRSISPGTILTKMQH